MIYLDHSATSFPKPLPVIRATEIAMRRFTNPGRGGYLSSMEAARAIYSCREKAAQLFASEPEQVVFTPGCTYGLNVAIRSLIPPGGRVVISGFEHNAVLRPLCALGAQITIAGRKLFDREDTLKAWEGALKRGADGAVFTHVSNAFGYILPVEEMGELCRHYGVPFILDAAQSAGRLPVGLSPMGASYIAMPGHKGLLGPQGVGILLCGDVPEPLVYGGTGSSSQSAQMPDWLPDRAEAGTVNVPGICGLSAGLEKILRLGIAHIARRESAALRYCLERMKKMPVKLFAGQDQAGVLSFVPQMDCETFAGRLGERGIAVRGGLHCAPLAHESADTLESGTVRISFGYDINRQQLDTFLNVTENLLSETKKF